MRCAEQVVKGVIKQVDERRRVKIPESHRLCGEHCLSSTKIINVLGFFRDSKKLELLN